MSNSEKSIDQFDLNIICEYFSTLQRQGPGSEEVTIKAASFIEQLNDNSKIVDIGCGTGKQTLTLAEHLPGQITGIDLFPTFIDLFNSKAQKQGLAHRVKGKIESMEELSFPKSSLDLIWSEGAIYNIGFKRGITEWKELLKPGGYLAVTEATWFTASRPVEIENYWLDAYPEIDTIPNKLEQMQQVGYEIIAAFTLPEPCWTTNYFAPQIARNKEFEKLYPNNKSAQDLIATMRHEAKMYDQYKAYYGYTFFIGRKAE